MKTNDTLEAFSKSIGCASYEEFKQSEDEFYSKLKFTEREENIDWLKSNNCLIESPEAYARISKVITAGAFEILRDIVLNHGTARSMRKLVENPPSMNTRNQEELLGQRFMMLWIRLQAGLLELHEQKNVNTEEICEELQNA